MCDSTYKASYGEIIKLPYIKTYLNKKKIFRFLGSNDKEQFTIKGTV